MPMPLLTDTLEDLPRSTASEVKKHGWRGIMRTVADSGKVLITNHNDPEAVILSIREYTAMVDAAKSGKGHTPAVLQILRKNFDERLASLDADHAGQRLRDLMGQPAELGGKVKAGTGY